MAPDYVYIAPTGQVLDRDAILAIIRSPSYRLKQGTRTEMVVRPLTDDAAALVHRWQGEGAFEGKAFRDDHRCTTLCVRCPVKSELKVNYDAETDTRTVVFRDVPVAESDEDKPGVILDYDAAGNRISIEVLNASMRVQGPRSVALATHG